MANEPMGGVWLLIQQEIDLINREMVGPRKRNI